MDNQNLDFIVGRNSVKDYLKTGKSVNKLFVDKNAKGSVKEIIELARQNKVVIVNKDKSFLDNIGKSHQGVALSIPPFEYTEFEDLLESVSSKQNPIILMLDEIEDVNNMGAIIRTAECAGVDGIIVPKRNNAPINTTVAKVSEGALSNMKISQVTNLSDTVKKLKDNGFWVVGSTLEESTNYTQVDYNMPVCLIVGNEAKGISKKLLEKCDFKIKIPMLGKTQSLNVSVATGVVLFEMLRNRESKKEN